MRSKPPISIFGHRLRAARLQGRHSAR